MKPLECSLTPDSGIVAVTNFSINCSTSSENTYEVFDKSPSDPKYFSGKNLNIWVEFIKLYCTVDTREPLQLSMYSISLVASIPILIFHASHFAPKRETPAYLAL